MKQLSEVVKYIPKALKLRTNALMITHLRELYILQSLIASYKLWLRTNLIM